MRIRILSLALITVLGRAWCASAPRPSPTEEFVGPFASWRNVRTQYGAVGDGRADDTAAIQRALDDLREHKAFCVLYFPRGVYRVTDTLHTDRAAHTDCLGVSVVGEGPATTVIRWDGKPGGTIFRYDAWYSRISRLTLDGAGRAGVALAYGPAFSTYNETSDMVFRDCATGMQMATGDNGQAENAVLRCRFLRCSNAGLTTVNFNSMDIWAWYCRFEDCGYGMYNGAGNFHAYHCLFLRSKKADIGTQNLMVFSFANNTSIGSRCFLDFATGHTWGSPCSVTGNRIIDPTGDVAIRLGNAGPYLVADNVIRSRPGAKGPVLEMTWGDQLLVGNTYTVPDPVKEAGRFRRVDERVVSRATIDARPPALPPTPPNRHRRVFDVAIAADANAIQHAIDAASKLKGQRPIVHLPPGTYAVTRTLTVPPGADLQLVGDGGAETATVLRWTGPNTGVVLRLAGPSKATVRDLMIDAGGGTGILIDRCDQPGGLVFADQANLQGKGEENAPRAGLLVNGVTNSDAMLLCLQGGTCQTWVDVRGRGGVTSRGQVNVYAGATGTSEAQYSVERGGRLVVRSVYHEVSGKSPQGVLLRDSGVLSIDATRFSYNTTADRPLIKVDGFRGDFAILTGLLLPVGSEHTARVEITGSGDKTNVLCAANLFWQNGPAVSADAVWRNAATPPAHAAMLLCNENLAHGGAESHSGYAPIDNRGAANDAFIQRMLKPLRTARMRLPEATASAATSVQIHRVICNAGRGGVCMELRAD